MEANKPISRRDVLKTMGATATVGLGVAAASTPAAARKGAGSYFDCGSEALIDYYEGHEIYYTGETTMWPGGLEGECGPGQGAPARYYCFQGDELSHKACFERDANLPSPIPGQYYKIQGGNMCDENSDCGAHYIQFAFRPLNKTCDCPTF